MCSDVEKWYSIVISEIEKIDNTNLISIDVFECIPSYCMGLEKALKENCKKVNGNKEDTLEYRKRLSDLYVSIAKKIIKNEIKTEANSIEEHNTVLNLYSMGCLKVLRFIDEYK